MCVCARVRVCVCPIVVERRRRDRINELIKTLAQLVPGCQKKDTSTGTIIGVSMHYICACVCVSVCVSVCVCACVQMCMPACVCDGIPF